MFRRARACVALQRQQPTQVALDPTGVCASGQRPEPIVGASLARLTVVGLEDRGLRLHHLAERPIRDAVAVRKAAPPPHVRDPVRRRERVRAPRSAGSCRSPGHRRVLQAAGAVASCPRERVEYQGQLLLTPDQWRERGLRTQGAVRSSREAPRIPPGDLPCPSPAPPAIAVLDAACVARTSLAHENGPRVGGLFDSKRGRDHVAGSNPLPRTGPAASWTTASPVFTVTMTPAGRRGLRARRAPRAPGRPRAPRERRRQPSRRRRYISRSPSEALDLLSHPRYLWTNCGTQILGISVVADYGRIDELREENRDHLAFFAAEQRTTAVPHAGQKRALSGSPEAALGARSHATSIGRSQASRIVWARGQRTGADAPLRFGLRCKRCASSRFPQPCHRVPPKCSGRGKGRLGGCV